MVYISMLKKQVACVHVLKKNVRKTYSPEVTPIGALLPIRALGSTKSEASLKL
jgi:hypothetical protein